MTSYTTLGVVGTSTLLAALLGYVVSSRTAAAISLSAVKSENAAVKLPFSPVAVFVGGTSGLGQVCTSLPAFLT